MDAASFKQALVVLDGARECPLTVTEQFGLDETLRKLREVGGNEIFGKTFAETTSLPVEGNIPGAPNGGRGGTFAGTGYRERA